MMILAIVNRKGGTGKTTVATAIATRLAEDRRVLLVDLDSQANATEMLAIKLQPGVFTWLGAKQAPAVVRWGAELDVLPGDASTEYANNALAAEGDIAALQRALQPLTYQVVILDCPPSMSMLTRAAIYAADYVFCPTIPEYLSVAGVRQLMILLSQVRQRFKRPVQLLGILPNKYDRRTKEHKANLTDLVKAYGVFGRDGGRIWPPLRQSIAVSEASAQGQPVWATLSGKVREEWAAMADRVARYG